MCRRSDVKKGAWTEEGGYFKETFWQRKMDVAQGDFYEGGRVGLGRAPPIRLAVALVALVFFSIVVALYLNFFPCSAEARPRGEFENKYERCMRLRTPSLRMPSLRQKHRIAVSVASFRDSRCAETLRQMFLKADDPDSVVALVCEQNGEAPTTPTSLSESCLVGPVANGEVRVISIPASKATGPCTARARAATLWQGESLYLQVDAHTFFSRGWDTIAREMVASAGDANCVFSTYAIDSSEDKETFIEEDVPIINDLWRYMDNGVLQQATSFHSPGQTPPARSIGGGFFLAPGDVLANVPLDPNLDGLFQMEELLWASRLYTHGYDLRSPSHNLVAHVYNRKDERLPVHPDGMDFGRGEAQAYALWSGEDNEDARQSLEEGYGFGTERTLQEFWESIRFNPLTAAIDEHTPWPASPS